MQQSFALKINDASTGGNFVGACVTERMRELHATFPATNAGNFVNIFKKGFKTKINRMNVENFAAFLYFWRLSSFRLQWQV